MDFSVTVSRDSEEPVYEQIARQIRTGIGEGILGAGSALPSVRALASDLGLNLNTIARAYRLLAAEGFVEIQHRRKVVVAAPAPSMEEGRVATIRKEFREMLHRLRQAGVRPDSIRRIVSHEISRLDGSSKIRG